MNNTLTPPTQRMAAGRMLDGVVPFNSPHATFEQPLVWPDDAGVHRGQRMRILGIDPGLRLTGYGLIDYAPRKPVLVDGGVIRLDATKPLHARLLELADELDAILAEHRPEVCAVEQLYSHYAHPRTALMMAHARGVILLAATRRGIRVEQYPANRIKQSVTGHGHAAKHQVQRAIQQVWNLPEPPDPPDVADALAVALCCGMRLMRK